MVEERKQSNFMGLGLHWSSVQKPSSTATPKTCYLFIFDTGMFDQDGVSAGSSTGCITTFCTGETGNRSDPDLFTKAECSVMETEHKKLEGFWVKVQWSGSVCKEHFH